VAEPYSVPIRSLVREGLLMDGGQKPCSETGRMITEWVITAAGIAAVEKPPAKLLKRVLAEYYRAFKKGTGPVRVEDVIAAVTAKHHATREQVEAAIDKLVADGLITGAGRTNH
jgi:hypothetical protein